MSDKWWTDELYDKAYDMIGEKYPVVVPSYNRPDPITIKSLFSDMNEEYNWPVIILVRESQYNDYIHLESKYITICELHDDMIHNIGLTRKAIVDLIGNRYDNIFMADDDITGIGYLTRGYNKRGQPISSQVTNVNPVKVLAMWQYIIETASSHFNVTMSCTTNPGYAFPECNSSKDYSIKIMTGRYAGFLHVNLKSLRDNGINYRSSDICGHEDTDLMIRCIMSGLMLCQVSSIFYTTVEMSYKEWGYDSVYDRLVVQNNKVRDNYSDIDWLKFEDNYHDKGKLPTITVNWRRVRSNMGIKDHKMNIWR